MKVFVGCFDLREVAVLKGARARYTPASVRSVPPNHRSFGGVLIVVLIMLVVLASLALLMARTTRTEAASAGAETARLKAGAVADGAVVYLRSALLRAGGTMPTDAQLEREAVQVGDGYFWFLKHDKSATGTGYSFGITDEGGKLDINRAEADALSRLPGMSQDLADAIVDWRDADDEPGAGGAESGYYLSQNVTYMAKNEPFESLDELLMVRGFTRSVLYGGDKNRNMVVDAGETASTATGGSSSIQIASGASGVADYLTLYSSYSTDAAATGSQAPVNVNQASAQLTDLIVQAVGQDRAGAVLDNVRRGRPHRNVLDFYVKSQMTLDQFKKISDRVTTSGTTATVVRGMVNLNTAPKEVLTSLGDLTDGDALAIIGKRGDGDGFTSIVDLLDVIPAEHAVSVGSLVGVKPGAVSADIVAVDGSGKGFKRMQVVMSLTGSVLYVRDLTSLGWPLDPAILTNLRAGAPPMGGTADEDKADGNSFGKADVGNGTIGTGKVGTGKIGGGNIGNGSIGGAR